MHSNIFCVGAQARQTSAHGILPMFAANNDGSDLLKASITRNLSDFGMSIYAGDDDDFADRTGLLERADGMRDHRRAGDICKQFVKPHAPTAACGDDDGR